MKKPNFRPSDNVWVTVRLTERGQPRRITMLINFSSYDDIGKKFEIVECTLVTRESLSNVWVS